MAYTVLPTLTTVTRQRELSRLPNYDRVHDLYLAACRADQQGNTKEAFVAVSEMMPLVLDAELDDPLNWVGGQGDAPLLSLWDVTQRAYREESSKSHDLLMETAAKADGMYVQELNRIFAPPYVSENRAEQRVTPSDATYTLW